MKKIWPLLLITIALTVSSCEEALVGSNPKDSPVKTFNIFWEDLDRYYSFFELKNVDWDSVYSVYRPKVDENTSQEKLRDVLSEMLLTLKDGHVTLYTENNSITYSGWRENAPKNFYMDRIIKSYLNNPESDTNFLYGSINSRIGYLYINSFSSDEFSGFDEVFDRLDQYQALIIDIRSNGGGSDTNSRLVANHFTTERRPYRYTRYRNGPQHDDFTDWEKASIEPAQGSVFKGPVAVLTNRRVFSAAEDFCLAMQTIPDAKIVGDTTGGGSGNPIFRELPNGWTFRLSRWQSVNLDFVHYEGRGIYPDIPVWITYRDYAQNRDTILEKGLQYLYSELD